LCVVTALTAGILCRSSLASDQARFHKGVSWQTEARPGAPSLQRSFTSECRTVGPQADTSTMSCVDVHAPEDSVQQHVQPGVEAKVDRLAWAVTQGQSTPKRPWSEDEDQQVIQLVGVYGPRRWSGQLIPSSHGHAGVFASVPVFCVLQERVLTGGSLGVATEIATHIPGRVGKQCRYCPLSALSTIHYPRKPSPKTAHRVFASVRRERWQNHLDPSVSKAAWSPEVRA
jgi:hypothetical protein